MRSGVTGKRATLRAIPRPYPQRRDPSRRVALPGVTELVDGVVIGAGPNGLAAANVLADAGWDVVLLEEQDTPGGAVRTEELTQPGFHHDVFSSFYPLGVGSP